MSEQSATYVTTEGQRVRKMKKDSVRNPRCIDCNIDTDAINEQYMIDDRLWRAAHPKETGMLCVGCCERRLGRLLRREDFRPNVLAAFRDGLPISGKLRERIRKR